MEEIWKDIKGYESFYQVSNLGRVKSLERVLEFSRYGNYRVKERILKPGINTGGYLHIGLHRAGVSKIGHIHQLVAEAFLNHIPCGLKLVVNHKNFIKTDNRVENLEIVTNRENCNLKHIKSSSIYVGVHWSRARNKWKSAIKFGTKQKHLGYYDSEYDAHLAYENALNNFIP